MKKKLLNIAIVVLFSLGLTVLANTIFEIDEAFFTETGIGSGDYSPLHFNYDGNNADGIIFWGDSIVQTGEIIMSGITINCEKQLKGLYLNTTRGNKIWPLDQATLDILSGSASFSGYNTLTMTGGFFTECTGDILNLGYAIDSGEVYGYIEHTYNSEIYKLWAGVDYNFSSGSAISNFSGTLVLMTGANITSEGFLFDNYGGIANVYSNQDLMGYLSFTGTEITTSGSDYYTIYTGIQVNISSNQDSTFELSGDLVAMLTGDLTGGIAIDQIIELIDGNGPKNIQLTVSNASGTNVSNLTVILNRDLIAPILSFTDGVATGPVQSDIIIVDRDDATVTKWMYTGGICSSNSGDYSNTTTGRTINTENFNGQYVCLYAEDNVGNISTAVSVNDVNIDITDPTFAGVTSGTAYSGDITITFGDTNLSGATLNGVTYTSGTVITGDNSYVFVVSDLAGNSTGASFEIDQTAPVISFIDFVEAGPVASDTVSVNFTDASFSGYKLVTNTGDCSGTGLTDYTGAIIYDDISNNGKYFCAYATDELGNSALIYSDNTLNINTSATTISITDNFSVIPVQTGTVTITGANISGDISYKIIDNIASCDNTGGVSYTGELIYNDETNNTKYICAYASGVVNGTFATGVSNEIKIDITDPTFAGVTSGTAYSGDVTIIFGDINLSGATLNGATYTSGTVITGDNSYIFIVSDLAGNSTGAIFSIDKTAPVILFTDPVELGPVASDTVSVNFADASFSGYKLVTNTGDCSGTGLADYTGAILYDDISNNGDYFCAYATDELGNSALIYSDNTLNINTLATTISITDNFGAGPVQTGTVNITGFNITGNISYKIIDNIASCDNTGGVSYTGELTYNDETNNTKYICAYASGIVNGTFATGVSNEINIDITDPTVGGIIEGGSYTGSIVITYSDTNLSGSATLDGVDVANGATVSTTGSHIFIVSDLAGNSVTINFTVTANDIPDTENPVVSLSLPTNGSTITGSSSTFSWIGTDNVAVSFYNLYINGPTTYTGVGVTSPVSTPLATGDYTWYVIATDTSGNTGQSATYNLTMTNAATIDTTDPVVELLYPTSGLVIDSNSVNLQWSGSDNIAVDFYDIYINGSTNYSLLDIVATSQVLSPIINGSYTWYVIATDVNGNTGHSDTYPLVISGSTIVPTLVSPISGANIYIGDLDLAWSGTSSSGFEWQIANDTSFANIVSSGETDNLTVSVLNDPDFMTGLFYWRVISNENVGVSDYWSVNIIDMTGGVDIEVDDFDFDSESDANLSEVYESNEITIEGISDNVYVNAILEDDIGALFINDIMVGSQGLVKNGDNIYIELISSNEYDTKVSSYLMVGTGDNEVSDTFKLYTKEEADTELSYGQKLQAALLLDSVIDTYGDNTEKLAQFLITFKSILEDKSDWLEDEIDDLNSGDDELEIFVSQKASVDYMYDIVDDYLDDMDYEGHNTYTAPNGKTYIAEYRNDKLAYTSPDFMYDKFFPTRDQFTAHIDINNMGNYYGGDEGEKITAPNDKVYYIYQKNGKWTSTSFWYEKYFDTREQIIDYISANNPIDTWDHELDTDFDLLSFQAPNGSIYTIFKTSDEGNNPDMYSSYKFVTPKYFPTLQRVKDHIVSNNQ